MCVSVCVIQEREREPERERERERESENPVEEGSKALKEALREES